ncbi:hypothetical protein KSP39_PZI011909 [Platanthera zijinensis]|uniref:Uncharacterized protein n=1 Tax=Platanthera zijinensis TaxID=2320716 RepID=A0AAP0G535_9ASPA
MVFEVSVSYLGFGNNLADDLRNTLDSDSKIFSFQTNRAVSRNTGDDRDEDWARSCNKFFEQMQYVVALGSND